MLLTFPRKYSIIKIWEPRYHDKVVLVATRKIAEKNKIVIKHPHKENGAYDGTYFLSGVVASACKIGTNGKIPCYEVPLSLLEKER